MANIDRARSYIGSASMMEIRVNGSKVGDLVLGPRKPVADTEVYYNTYDILPLLQDGTNAVGLMCSSVWSMGDSACGMLKIWYKDGSTQVIATDSTWKMTGSSFITRSTQSSGEDEDATLMVGWDAVGYDTSGWSDAELLNSSPVYDGVYHVDEDVGVRFANVSVSGDYAIELDMTITSGSGTIVFGSNASMPWMWQFNSGSKNLRIHDIGTWTCSKRVKNDAIVKGNTFHVKIEVVGTSVSTYINGALIDTTTVAAGTTDGNVGVRTAGTEWFTMDNLKITQGETVLVDDSFDVLDKQLWMTASHGTLAPSISGTVVIEEVAPVNVYPSPDRDDTVDKTRAYCEDGTLYLPDGIGMHYSKEDFSGDYVIELEARSDKVFSLLFGTGSPFPAMWQFRGSTLNAHMPGGWSDIRSTNIKGMDITKPTKIRLEISGNDVTVTVNDTLNGGTITLPEGAASGKIGFRVASPESAEVNWVKVYQNGAVIFEDDFNYIDTGKWTFAAQGTGERYILDFGKNMSGYVRVSGQLEKGQSVTLAYSELVHEDGSLYPATTLWYPTCTYTFSGGEDVFEPHFFYTGFRYVEVTSDYQLPAEAFTACFVSDDVPVTGAFESSNDRLNRVYDMYYQSQRSNMVAIYTDCPQREKNGWTGDASVVKEASSILLGDYTTAESFMRLAELSMYENGQPCCILPRRQSEAGLPEEYDTIWASAYFTFPYYTWLQTGDTYYIEKMYDSLEKIFDFYISQAGSDYIYNCTRYSDWLGYDNYYGKLETGSLTAAYTYVSGTMLSEMAEAIGKDHSELDAYLAKMFDALQSAYNKGDYWAGNTQTNNSMALDFNLVPTENRDAILAGAVKCLTDYGSLRTGVIGSMTLYNVLSAENYHKELLDATITGEKCSFGYMLDNGATTMWELWDKAGESFHANVSSVPGEWESQNHCMFGGGVTSWIFEGLGGIRSTGPAYHTITYRPGLESELTWVNSSVDTMIGLTESNWTWENGVLDWTVTVPVNSTATIVIPVENAMVIKENGVNILAKDGDGLTYVGKEDGAYIYTVGSGTYNFHASAASEISDVTLRLTGEDTVTVDVETLTYTLSAENMVDLATAELTIELEEAHLAKPEVETCGNWYVISETYENGVLTVIVGNNDGANGTGDILTLNASHTGKIGAVEVAVTKAVLSAYLGEGETFVNAVIEDAAAETVIDYSTYDVNKDGTVNQLDITRAQRSFGGNDALADVNDDGTVDITDFVLILNNYSK